MSLLALDTSGPSGSAAILEGEQVLAETFWEAKASHSAELPVQVEKIIKKAGLSFDRIRAFAVTIGPGSFTGLRVGLSFVKGWALSGALPVAGVSTLQALAFPMREESILCPLLDARHDEVYGAVFLRNGEALKPLLPEKASPPSVFLEELKGMPDPGSAIALVGSGARRYEKEIRQALGERARFLDPSGDRIQASSVGRIGQTLIEKGETYPGGVDLKPNYLRASTPELKREKGAL